MDDLEKYALALRNTHYNKEGRATLSYDDEWVDESEWDDLFEQLKAEKQIMDYVRNQTVQTDEDSKARADACMERIKKAKAKEKGGNYDSGK